MGSLWAGQYGRGQGLGTRHARSCQSSAPKLTGSGWVKVLRGPQTYDVSSTPCSRDSRRIDNGQDGGRSGRGFLGQWEGVETSFPSSLVPSPERPFLPFWSPPNCPPKVGISQQDLRDEWGEGFGGNSEFPKCFTYTPNILLIFQNIHRSSIV